MSFLGLGVGGWAAATSLEAPIKWPWDLSYFVHRAADRSWYPDFRTKRLKHYFFMLDIGGLLADLLEGARWRNLSATALPPERTWTKFLAWAAAASLDPRALNSLRT
jgi:hypothetical protein